MIPMRSSITCFLTLAAMVLASGTLQAASLRDTTAETCGNCHQEIYQEWKSSMHANSSALTDPIHGAMYRKVIGDPTQEGVTKGGKYPVCLNCHAPGAALDGKTDLTAKPIYNDGITCVSCHLVEDFKGVQREDGKLNLGVKAFKMSEDTLQGSSGANRSPSDPANFHPFPLKGNAAILKGPEACLGCHDQRNNGNNVPLCMTGAEFRQANTFNCQQCHMAVVNGHADHSMAGGHVQDMVERSIILSLDASRDDKGVVKADVTLHNMLPHNVPTGAPFRNMFVVVTGHDADGNEVWRNFETHPIKEDPKSMLMLKLLDQADKPTSPPKATKQGADTRLKPHEIRTISYTIDDPKVTSVRSEVRYDLLLPALKKQLKTVPDELKQSKTVAFAQADL